MNKFCFVVLLAFVSDSLSSSKLVVDKINSSPYNPPPHEQHAKRARYMVHYVDWGVLSTISTEYNISGVPVPFTNIIAVSDGPIDSSTGIPYFYVSKLDTSIKDISKNNIVCLGMSEIETGYCQAHSYNPELPLCARLTLCGHFTPVDADEEKFALNAIFSRFPGMKDWPSSHEFFPAKLKINLIWLIDFFGGAAIVNPSDYFKQNPLKWSDFFDGNVL